jgi:hypothetical protein
MVVLMVGIPGVDAAKLPRSNGNLEFVSVDSVAHALAYLSERSCDAVMIGPDAPDMALDRLASLSRTGVASSNANSARPGSEARERPDTVEHVFKSGSIRDMERLMILDRLVRLNQNRTRSAESLEISVRTLRNKLRDYRTQHAPLVEVGVESD